MHIKRIDEIATVVAPALADAERSAKIALRDGGFALARIMQGAVDIGVLDTRMTGHAIDAINSFAKGQSDLLALHRRVRAIGVSHGADVKAWGDTGDTPSLVITPVAEIAGRSEEPSRRSERAEL